MVDSHCEQGTPDQVADVGAGADAHVTPSELNTRWDRAGAEIYRPRISWAHAA
jgi:hypothetical protein